MTLDPRPMTLDPRPMTLDPRHSTITQTRLYGALVPLPDALCLLIEYVMQTCKTLTCFFLANEKYERNTEHGK
jgi:hypothetical protein